MTSEGLKVFVEGPSSVALASTDAQRLVYGYAKQSGFHEYGMNRFMEELQSTGDPVFSVRGCWLLKSSQWNTRSVRL